MEIGAFEAKNTLGHLLDRVEQGEEIVITRHGRPVARIIPNTAGLDRDQARDAFARIRKRAAKFSGSRLDWKTLKADRDLGRP
ncbi:MAG TPA: type II toxin-antitoxin system prevent-host-death family antitoxin [Acidobacteriaceae bacterium]|nr:type II toxin-antitoxin system prevent-host-death family antitoxin [Acidobacteriaceae bacterium]